MANPEPCNVPLKTVEVFGHKVTCHEGVLEFILRIEAAWKALGGHNFYQVRVIQAYNCRKTRSGTRWSDHAKGWAFDINPEQNPYGKRLVTDMPRRFVELWKAEGFGWGGDWSGSKDCMHFSKNPLEGGDGLLSMDSQVHKPTQGDGDLTPDEHQMLVNIQNAVNTMNARLANFEKSRIEDVDKEVDQIQKDIQEIKQDLADD